MYNVFQINQAVDSIQKQTFAILNNFVEGIKNSHPYFQAHKFKHDSISLRVIASMKIPNETIKMNQISTPDLRQAYNMSISKIRTTKENLQSQKLFTETIMDDVSKFYIEFNRKFALTATILVLFFVGAPLGAIVKKGGFGAGRFHCIGGSGQLPVWLRDGLQGLPAQCPWHLCGGRDLSPGEKFFATAFEADDCLTLVQLIRVHGVVVMLQQLDDPDSVRVCVAAVRLSSERFLHVSSNFLIAIPAQPPFNARETAEQVL